jgi:hypothetical protein
MGIRQDNELLIVWLPSSNSHEPRDDLNLINYKDRTTNGFRRRFSIVQGHNS